MVAERVDSPALAPSQCALSFSVATKIATQSLRSVATSS
jgi:hypothetical protein